MSKEHIIIIGSGFAGLSASCFLAQAGYQVTVIEKNSTLGGRCRAFEADGFVFDMGPSWYWMPDVFERFFEQFGYAASDFYELKRLDPSYQVVCADGDVIKIPANYPELQELFERYEPGSAAKLESFLKDAEYKYEVGMNEFVHKPSLSIFEFMDARIIKNFFRMDLFKDIAKEIHGKFKNPKLRQILEFPVLFLGAKPSDTPALYSLMNYADIKLGTWYPMGGMVQIPQAMVKVAKELGVTFKTDEEVKRLNVSGRRISSVTTDKGTYEADGIISGADYHHTETALLPTSARSYSDTYWDKRDMAPSSLLFYVGVSKKCPGLEHHNLFFDTDFGKHASQIYDTLEWPDEPLFYVCAPSKTDDHVAPEGSENLFFLVPISAGIEDSEAQKEAIFEMMLHRMQDRIGLDIRDHIVYKKAFCVNEFISEYHSFKGNAYGLANTLFQTAFLKPKMQSKRVENLIFAGQLTTPGPGMPPSLISGEVAAKYWMAKKSKK